MTPPLPAVWAAGVANRLDAGGRGSTSRGKEALARRAAALLRGLEQAGALSLDAAVDPVPHGGGSRGAGKALVWDRDWLRSLTAGRLLMVSDIYRRALRERGLPFADHRPPEELRALVAALAAARDRGEGQLLPGIVWRHDGSFACGRCGGDALTPWPCSRCGQPRCLTCETCRSLGLVRGCDVLFLGPDPGPVRLGPQYVVPLGPPERRTEADVPWGAAVPRDTVPLSPVQVPAAEALLDFVRDRDGAEALVWAACGAGKTEVAIPAIRWVLAAGKRVLFAVPRRDVVAELGERLARYVRPRPSEVLYGGAPAGAGGLAPRVVATTHQCLRFGSVFDLVVVDEVDAYPYRTEPFLRRGLQRALRPGGKLIAMTATPESDRLRRARRGEVRLVVIPARHHGYPLPVPRWVRDRHMPVDVSFVPGRTESPLFGPPTLRAVTECLAAGPTVVFCPTVALVEMVAAALAEKIPAACLWTPCLQTPEGGKEPRQGENDRRKGGEGSRGGGTARAAEGQVVVSFIHSGDRWRREKLEAFRRHDIALLVSTTVLERGITVPGVQVVVLYAHDERVFDEAALVQMAGRTGRAAAFPHGLVRFVGRTRTAAVGRALARIRELNERAARNGYLREACLVDAVTDR